MVELIKQNFDENCSTYLKFKNLLINLLGDNVFIEHIGSTAIPNMLGKNIIDILIGANDNNDFENFSKILVNNGFFVGKNSTEIYNFFASKIEETKSGDVHIHLVINHTERFNDFLILKEYLLNNKKECVDYCNFKKYILSKTTDRTEYRRIKSEYVTNLLNRAKQN